MESTLGDSGKNSQGKIVETAETREKNPRPWFVVDGENRRRMKKQLAMENEQKKYHPGVEQQGGLQDVWRRQRGEIEKSKPIELHTAEDGKNLLEVLERVIGQTNEMSFSRSDGKTVTLQDLGTTGIAIKVPEEIIIDKFRYTGSVQVLNMEEARELEHALHAGVKSAGFEPGKRSPLLVLLGAVRQGL